MKYVMLDVTMHSWTTNPSHSTAPFYRGTSPEVPTVSFLHGRHDYKVLQVFEVGNEFNPFHVPVVMARRIMKGEK